MIKIGRAELYEYFEFDLIIKTILFLTQDAPTEKTVAKAFYNVLIVHHVVNILSGIVAVILVNINKKYTTAEIFLLYHRVERACKIEALLFYSCVSIIYYLGYGFECEYNVWFVSFFMATVYQYFIVFASTDPTNGLLEENFEFCHCS